MPNPTPGFWRRGVEKWDRQYWNCMDIPAACTKTGWKPCWKRHWSKPCSVRNGANAGSCQVVDKALRRFPGYLLALDRCKSSLTADSSSFD